MAPPAKTAKLPSILPELAEFGKLAAKVPYPDLAQHYLDAGWVWALRETAVLPCYDGTVCMSYELLVGRSIETLEAIDTLTIRMAPNMPGPISAAARAMATPSILYLLTGRLPPPPANSGGGATVEMKDRDVTLKPEPENDGGEYVDDTPGLDIVARREPDGLPIFIDLYALGGDTGKILDTLLTELEGFMRTAESVEQVKAVFHKNPDAITFLKDFGDDRDKAEIKRMGDEHSARLAPKPATEAGPRRRQRAAH